jgi:hypothetical protein
MIIMRLPDAPDGTVPMRRFLLESSGLEVRPDKETGRLWVSTEAEAAELEREGWQRVATSKAVDDAELRKSVAALEAERAGHQPTNLNAINDGSLLHRAAEAEFRHHTRSEPAPHLRRIVVGEVDAGSPFGRVHVEHDELTDDVSISGVAFDLSDNVDEGLAVAFRRATAAFIDADQDASEQNTARATISALVRSILAQNGVVADGVRRQKFRERFGV